MKTLRLIFLLLFASSPVFSQNPEWAQYLHGKNIRSIVVEENIVWVGTTAGLVKINKITGEKTFFNTSNSGLPHNNVLSLAIDGSGNTWLGTGGGLVRFDGTNWTIYNRVNSGLPHNHVWALAIDGSGNTWIGTEGGLARFDGTNWTVYDTSNSGLPLNDIRALAIDGSGNTWIGIYQGGLARFDGTNWTIYNRVNSGLPNNLVLSLAIDGSGDKWIGTWYGGLARFDGMICTVYDTFNSGLPGKEVLSLAIDGSGNKWIGTDDGLAVYQEGGVVSVEDKTISGLPDDFSLLQNYPNPFNPSTNISFMLPSSGQWLLSVYNLRGQLVRTLLDERLSEGAHTVVWDGRDMNGRSAASGVYLYELRGTAGVERKRMLLLR